jgi:uncharacterized protein (TIGR00299 family) protein
MKQLYLDLFSGISGDMFIGALIDLGVDAAQLERELRKLGVEGYHLHFSRRQKMGIEGVKFDVHLAHDHEHGHDHDHKHEPEHTHGHTHTHTHSHPHSHEPGDSSHTHQHSHAGESELSHPHSHEHTHTHTHGHEHGHEHEHEHEHGRNFREIRDLIQRSSLSDWVKSKSISVFKRIAVAEGKIHGVPAEDVGFHEVGALDSIVDVVGACIGLEMLGKPRVGASHVTEGTGWVHCAHGRFPIPAPATLSILGARGIAVSQSEEPNELVTPTGAALVAEFAESFGPMRALTAEKIGYGIGTRDNRTRPNVLRAVLGPAAAEMESHDWETDQVAILETNLDDIAPEIIGHFAETCLAAGALDVWHTPIQMKKFRPGTQVSVLCDAKDADRLSAMLLKETSAFGVRRHVAERRKLQREIVSVDTKFGTISIKLGKLDGAVIQVAPEFESCKEASFKSGVVLKEVYEAARTAHQQGKFHK